MYDLVSEILKVGSIISILPAFFIFVFNYKRFVLQSILFVGFFVIFRMLAETTFVLSNFLIGANLPLIAIHSIAESVMVSLVCAGQPKYRRLRPKYLIIAAFLGLVMIVSVILRPNQYPSEVRILQFTFLIAISLYHLYKAILFDVSKPYELFILIALFCYFSMSSITFYLANKVNRNWTETTYIVHDMVNIATNLFIAFTLLNFLKVFYGTSTD